MFILFCYLMAFIPLVIGMGLWLFCKKIVWWESLVGTAIGIIIVLSFHYVSTKSMTDDYETWSGQVIEAVHVPSWTEYYEYAVYRTEYYTTTEPYTDSKGKSHTRTVTKSRPVFDHWESATRFHNEYYYVNDNLIGTFNIDLNRFNDIKQKFGNELNPQNGCRHTSDHNSKMLSGDKFDYHTVNTKQFVYPTNTTKQFENRVKASSSIFKFVKLPENNTVTDYPVAFDQFNANRLLGKVGITGEKFEQLNSELGFRKKINIIAVGFDADKTIDDALQVESKWFGGKKNDLVICFSTTGNALNKPNWVYIFGWTESDLCKENLKSIILKNGMKDSTLPFIKDEIIKNYKIKDFHKFDYLTIEIPFKYYIWLFIIEIILVGGWFLFAFFNDADKISKEDVNKKKFSRKNYNYYDSRFD